MRHNSVIRGVGERMWHAHPSTQIQVRGLLQDTSERPHQMHRSQEKQIACDVTITSRLPQQVGEDCVVYLKKTEDSKIQPSNFALPALQ